MTVIPVSDHFVRQIRVAEPQPNVTRVVLDLEAPVESTTSRLDNPTRLIIELRAAGSAPETTKAPVREPPALIEPAPAPKPARAPAIHAAAGRRAGHAPEPQVARRFAGTAPRVALQEHSAAGTSSAGRDLQAGTRA